jgi:aminopeptidase N
VPCPYGTYDVVFAPELGPLAVSLPGVMMVSEIMLRRMVVPGDDQVPLVLAHEVAHLWFGCLVEGRWWDDLWLAEALATYLSYLAGEEALGLGRPWAEFIMREQTGAYRADCLPSTQPVSSPVATAADAMNRPSAITYNKGASVIRQLAALIGGEALRAGLHDYLVTYGGAATTLDDIVGCWSRASGRDLGGWAQAWLRTAGVDTMRPELTVAPDGSIRSLTLARRPPATGTRPLPGLDALRTHRVAIGAYDRQGDGLSLRHRTEAEVSSADTLMPGLAGIPAPDAFVVNEGALTFARIRFDDRSFRALAACAMDIGDPLTEGVCWNAAWDMSTAAELSVGEFTDLVARRLDGEHPPPGVAELLGRAVTAADHYAPSAHRPRLRERIADAALAGVGRAEPGGRVQHALAIAFAASAHTGAQLGLLRSWLSGTSLPEGVESGLELRGEILATLSARGLATDADLGALAADDRVGGEAQAATCCARRPDPAAKRAAWTAAIADGQVPHLALAHARGIWVPGQEDILAPYRDRYFREALPAAGKHQPRWDARLAAALYPATLADAATIAATSAALDRGGLSGPLRAVLLEQRAVLEQVIAARALPRPA